MGLRPNRTPRAFARIRPSLVRLKMRWRSNSARPPSTVSINFPGGVVLSAQPSPSDLKLAPAFAIVSRVFSKSRVDRARRSSFVTTTTSPGSREAKQRASTALSVVMPDCFSANTCVAPASRNRRCGCSCSITIRRGNVSAQLHDRCQAELSSASGSGLLDANTRPLPSRSVNSRSGSAATKALYSLRAMARRRGVWCFRSHLIFGMLEGTGWGTSSR